MNNSTTTSIEKNTKNAINNAAASSNDILVASSMVHENPAQEPSIANLLKIYSTQNRECWLCDGIAKKINENVSLSDDDSWHFTSCVMSWEHVHRLTD